MRAAAFVLLAFAWCSVAFAEDTDTPRRTPSLVSGADAAALIPLADSTSLFNTGYGASVSLEYPIFPFLSPFIRAGASYAPLQASGGLFFTEGDAGLALTFSPVSRFVLRLEGSGGVSSVSSELFSSGNAYTAGARFSLGYRLQPGLTLFASGGLSSYLGTSEAFYTAASGGLSARFSLGGNANAPAVKISDVKTDAVFPVFYSYYDDHPFGSVVVTNGEDADIRDVQVSFVVDQYMDRPKVCASFPELAKGASVKAPLSALFTDSVLTLTEGTAVRGEISVEYRHIGAKRRVSFPVEMRMHHRNAMNWLDDRRAAAFASPKDPATLWFSRFVSGIVRDRMRGDIDKNLQYAVGIFEAERLFGLNYVVDPASSYVEKSADEATVDYLQFPYQTLFYRGGDCDDLTILYTSLLQSLGIQTAFITIPGHIYMAFALDMSEERARVEFYDQGLLAYRDGKVWVPVEITMVKEGFVKAWRVGAKEWQDNTRIGAASMYPLVEAWKTYPPVGVPNVNPRFTLPDETQVAQAFDMSLDRYVAREIETQVATTKALRFSEGEAAAQNALGILYGRYGMLKESWKEFSSAAQAGYAPAWVNLGNVAFLRKDYKLSLQYYQYAYQVSAADSAALLGVARSYYELEHFSESDKAYAELKTLDPELAAKYGYLASILGGEGRAWSLSERMTSTIWVPVAEPERPSLFAQAPEPVPQAIPEASPNASVKPVAPLESLKPADSEKPLPAPVVAEALPDDKELAEKKAALEAQAALEAKEREEAARQEAARQEAARQAAAAAAARQTAARQAAAAAAVKPAGPAPVIAAELPEDKELAEKKATLAAQAAREAKEQAAAAQAAPAPAAVARPVQPAQPTPASEPAPAVIQAPVAPPAASAQAQAPVAAQQPATPAPAASKTAPVVAQAPVAAPAASAQAQAPMAAQRPATPAPAAPEPAPISAVVATPAPARETEPVQAPVAPAVRAPEPTAPAIVQAPAVGDSDIPLEPASTAVALGFAGMVPAIGTWEISGDKATAAHLEPEEYYAKLVLPLDQDGSKIAYAFKARSTGYKWVGLGIHVFARSVVTHKGYGEGQSLLVWFTSDPVHRGDALTRVQVYRSLRDTYMEDLLGEASLPESIFDLHSYRVEVDPAAGSLVVLVDGVERYRLEGLPDFSSGSEVVLRALDKAEFSDFRVDRIR
jgi:hypothetical protein